MFELLQISRCFEAAQFSSGSFVPSCDAVPSACVHDPLHSLPRNGRRLRESCKRTRDRGRCSTGNWTIFGASASTSRSILHMGTHPAEPSTAASRECHSDIQGTTRDWNRCRTKNWTICGSSAHWMLPTATHPGAPRPSVACLSGAQVATRDCRGCRSVACHSASISHATLSSATQPSTATADVSHACRSGTHGTP